VPVAVEGDWKVWRKGQGICAAMEEELPAWPTHVQVDHWFLLPNTRNFVYLCVTICGIIHL